jgi:AmmeMemoRadiSam system protein B
MMREPTIAAAPVRPPAVAGSFYPADARGLAALVREQLDAADAPAEAVAASQAGLAGILVPHAGLVYSGRVAAAGWRLAAGSPSGASVSLRGDDAPTITGHPTIVLLGTNHSAAWLDGIGVWDAGAWRTPLGDVEVDASLAVEILTLGSPFRVDREAHRSEHSLEVQLPFLQIAMPGARIVPLSIGLGRGERAMAAGDHLGALLAARRRTGALVTLAISTDMAHYPSAAVGASVTEALEPAILGLDPVGLARHEADLVRSGRPGLVCGMCGIEPTVVGLAALRAMGVRHGVRLTSATSADVGGPTDRVVGYLAAAFPG